MNGHMEAVEEVEKRVTNCSDDSRGPKRGKVSQNDDDRFLRQSEPGEYRHVDNHPFDKEEDEELWKWCSQSQAA
jgi:hypothetical protein